MKKPVFKDHRVEVLLRETFAQKPTAVETEQAWQTFVAQHQPKRTFRRLYLAVAAAAAVSLVVLVLRTTLFRSAMEGVQVFASLDAPNAVTAIEKDGKTIVSTPAGVTTNLLLSDGTEVLLGANSRLEYPTQFSGTMREVALSGEARFCVTKHGKSAFVVQAEGLRTNVFGTVFDVRAYPKMSPDVALYEGSVGVTYRGEELRMSPGQQALVGVNGTLQLTSMADSRSSWAEGNFSFDDQNLRTVMQEIGAWYNLSVIFQSSDLLAERIHFRFSRQCPVEVILQILNDVGIARFYLSDGTITVEPEPTAR